MKDIKITIPKNYMNCDVSVNNVFICNTNISCEFYKFECPLPTPDGKWVIRNYVEFERKRVLTLTDKEEFTNE